MGILALDIFITKQFAELLVMYPQFVPVVAFAAEGLGVLVLLGLLLFIFSHEHARIGLANVVVVLASGIIAYLGALFIKTLIVRPRPGVVLDNIRELTPYVDAMNAFPSGHATLFFAIAIAVTCFHKRIGALFFLLAFVIAIARVFAGVHWITDVAAGALLGIGIGWGIYRAASRIGLFKRMRYPRDRRL